MKEQVKIRNPNDIGALMRTRAGKRQENFWVITLDGAHYVIGVHHISKGLVNRAIVHPREVFYPAIKDNASSIAVCHNHPSGSMSPSDEDNNITGRLEKAAYILGFNFLDHVIIGKGGRWFSYRQAGLLKGFGEMNGFDFAEYAAELG